MQWLSAVKQLWWLVVPNGPPHALYFRKVDTVTQISDSDIQTLTSFSWIVILSPHLLIIMIIIITDDKGLRQELTSPVQIITVNVYPYFYFNSTILDSSSGIIVAEMPRPYASPITFRIAADKCYNFTINCDHNTRSARWMRTWIGYVVVLYRDLSIEADMSLSVLPMHPNRPL